MVRSKENMRGLQTRKSKSFWKLHRAEDWSRFSVWSSCWAALWHSKIRHFNSFIRKWLMIIPARRMMIMIINAKPRHTANCGTDRTSPTVVVVVVVVVKALLPELATVGSVFPPSALKHADSAPLTWAWLWCESRGLGQLERERERVLEINPKRSCEPQSKTVSYYQFLPECSSSAVAFSFVMWTPALTRAWSQTSKTLIVHFSFK